MNESARKWRVAPFKFDDPADPPPKRPDATQGGGDTADEPRARASRPPSRQGKRNVNFVLSEPAWEQLSILSVRSRRPIQDLMQEATDLLFHTQGLSRIARD